MCTKDDFEVSLSGDLKILDPRQRYQVTAASVIKLLKRFNNNSNYDVDAILMEFREYKSLPDSQLPIIASKYALEGFWSAMGELPL